MSPSPERTGDQRFGIGQVAHSYTGGTEYGSGTTAGPGAGNKTADFDETDSSLGKVAEKAGQMVGSEKLETKGRQRREERGAGEDE